MIPTLGLIAVGFGLCAAAVILLGVLVDCVLVYTGQPTISRRCLDAAVRRPGVAAVVSAVLALVLGMLLGHLFLGQAVPPPTSCACALGTDCGQQCPAPCPCRPIALGIEEECAQPVPEPKPKLLAFKQRICPACIRMEREIEKRADVQAAIKAAFDVKIYDWQLDRDVFTKHAVNDVPCVIVLDASGKEVKRFTGYKSPNELLRWLGLDAP